jgi:hypothetical protein
MSNLSAYLAEDISVAALLEETWARVRVGMVLWPNVSETIANRRQIGKWLSDLEIRRAIDSGRIIDRHRVRSPTDCWVINLVGFDSEAEPLGVILHLPIRRTDVLEIIEVFFFDSDFQLEGPIQWE